MGLIIIKVALTLFAVSTFAIIGCMWFDFPKKPTIIVVCVYFSCAIILVTGAILSVWSM